MRLIVVAAVLISSCQPFPAIINTSIACDKTDFLLRIKFNETFTGLIQTEKGDPNCVYVNASILRSSDYEVKIPLVGCETIRNAEGNYENEISVQNGNIFNSKTDKRYLLTCIPANPIFRDSQVTVSFGGVTIDTEMTTAVSLVNSPKVDYEVSVRDGDDPSAPPLKRPLAVGDRVVWGDFEVSRDEHGTTFLNHIKAWAFPTSNEVNIFCNLHVCADCEQLSCRSRPRRVPETSGDGTDEQTGEDLVPPIPIRTSFRLRRETEPLISTRLPIEMPSASSTTTLLSFIFWTFLALLFVNSADF
ncbi:zona pellucida-like domain protein [Necator americanus]|uniref:Zona pellucida-like domain protein n=1 Tax=Necator americanus TaxID=51031 RepID=W2SGU3_NECAM|nr:zona pellucida-like domain protein [Necator americanus]ETN68854.1 zona pellucida-like domain protein [Necator americanus]